MDKIWKSNLVYKALAVLLAVLLWFYVNPYSEKSFYCECGISESERGDDCCK